MDTNKQDKIESLLFWNIAALNLAVPYEEKLAKFVYSGKLIVA